MATGVLMLHARLASPPSIRRGNPRSTVVTEAITLISFGSVSVSGGSARNRTVDVIAWLNLHSVGDANILTLGCQFVTICRQSIIVGGAAYRSVGPRQYALRVPAVSALLAQILG
jgi:hypothetical protein